MNVRLLAAQRTMYEGTLPLSYLCMKYMSGTSPNAQKLKKAKSKKSHTESPKRPVYSNLVDVDANLTHDLLKGDIEQHLLQASRAGITGLVVPGSTIEESAYSIDVCKQYSGDILLVPTVGVHPYCATDLLDSKADSIAQQAAALIEKSEGKVVAVGECGLDYSPGFPSREVQVPVFESQVDLACKLQLPLFLHERLAHSDFLRILDARQQKLPKVLVHCFTGNRTELSAYIQRGYFVSISGVICKKGELGDSVREAIRQTKLPLDRVMVETDAPYLGFNGCREGYETGARKSSPNVPSALPYVVRALAECLDVSEVEVAMATTQNARNFFGKEF